MLRTLTEHTPAQPADFYRKSYPDITPQEVAQLYPLFIKAITAPTKAEQSSAFKEYRRKLAPIKKRNPQPKQELNTWM